MMYISCTKVFDSVELTETVGFYLSAVDLSSMFLVSSDLHNTLNTDRLWSQLCDVNNLKSLVSFTRTRGKMSPKEIYLSNLCVECNSLGRGMAIINLSGGSNDRTKCIPICSQCIADVQQQTKWSEKIKRCLVRTMDKIGDYNRRILLQKIPDSKNSKNRIHSKHSHTPTSKGQCRMISCCHICT